MVVIVIEARRELCEVPNSAFYTAGLAFSTNSESLFDMKLCKASENPFVTKKQRMLKMNCNNRTA